MLIRRETPADISAIRAVTAAAFARPEQPVPPEATLVDELRACDGWLAQLSFVALGDQGQVIGHVVCSRAHVETAPVLVFGPLSVHPGHQRRGVGHALVHAVLGAADALGEPLVVLLGDPAYYSRYGFHLGAEYGIASPDPALSAYFQVRPLTAYEPALRGAFRYTEPFDRV